tara:strand:+ start:17997 stop:18206 length:210 start_codon:yes stop_codon:yes gene_type:complete
MAEFKARVVLRAPRHDKDIQEVSVHGRQRWMDNIFIERLWRALKYKAVHLLELVAANHALMSAYDLKEL